MVTDQNDNVVARHDYLPYGEEIPNGTAGRSGNSFGLTGERESEVYVAGERDPEMTPNSDFFNARYFLAVAGSFLAAGSGERGGGFGESAELEWICLRARESRWPIVDPSGTTDFTPGECNGFDTAWCGQNGSRGGGGTSCEIDGVPSSCGEAYALLNIGAAVQCPNNVCSGSVNGQPYNISANAAGNIFANLYSTQLTLNCAGESVNDYQCAWSHWSSWWVQDGNSPRYFCNVQQIFNGNRQIWHNTGVVGDALAVGTAAAIALPYAAGYGAALLTEPGMAVAWDSTAGGTFHVIYGVDGLGWLSAEGGEGVLTVQEMQAGGAQLNRFLNVYNWTQTTLPTANPSAILATQGQTFSSCVMAAVCGFLGGLSPF